MPHRASSRLNPARARLPCPASSSICSPTTTQQFTEFVHYVDTGGERCAATFLVTLTPKPDSSYRDAGVQRLRNCNFFRCRDGLIHEMTIYYSNPGTAGDAEAHGARPTGFPQA